MKLLSVRTLLLSLGLLWAQGAIALETGPPVLESRTWTGAPANGVCGSPHFARGNTRYLTFACLPPLVPDDTNLHADVYLADRLTGHLERISVTSTGEEILFDSPEGFVSDDGRLVAFESRGPMHPDATQPPGWVASSVFLRDRLLGQTGFISPDVTGQVPFFNVTLRDVDADRAEIVIQTRQQLLDPLGDPLLNQQNLYIRNRQTGAIELVSVAVDGGLANGSSNNAKMYQNGRYVLFSSSASTIQGAPASGMNLYLRDRWIANTERLIWPLGGGEFLEPLQLDIFPARMTDDGRYVLFSSSSRELAPFDPTIDPLFQQVYLLDRQTNTLERLSVTATGTPGAGYSGVADMSVDARYLAFFSRATNLPAGGSAIYVIDRLTGAWANVTALLGPLVGVGTQPNLDLARDGSAIAFSWRSADPASPYFNRSLIFTVELRGAQPATPVPAPDLRWLALLAALLLAAVAIRRRVGS